MKKFFIALISSLTFFCFASYGQSNDSTKVSYSHWSVAANVGASVFDGDITQDYNTIFPKGNGEFAFGFTTEYTFNPRWGVGIEYMYLPMAGKDNIDDFSGSINNASFYLALNLSNFFYLDRISKWNVYANVGIGMSIYESEATSKRIPETTYIIRDLEDARATAIPFGINVEYNFSKKLAASWNTRYCLHNKDNFEAVKPLQGTTNDAILSSTLGIRYKFSSQGKTHVKNANLTEPVLSPLYKRYIDELTARLDNIEHKSDSLQDDLTRTQNTLGLATSRLSEVNEFFAKEYDGPDSDNDGVPDVRDKYPNTPPNTFVNYWGQPIPDEYIKESHMESIYFEFDKFSLTPNASDVIRRVALKMLKDPNIKIEIRGYCDNKGDAEYNLILSKKRSLTVKKTLTEEYDIDESRIIVNGLGKIIDKKDENTLNRRCDILFDR